MRFHKRVSITRKYYGKWWQVFGIKEKVVNTTIQLPDGKKIVVLQSLRLVKMNLPDVKWKGEWRLKESSLIYPVAPYSVRNLARIMKGIL